MTLNSYFKEVSENQKNIVFVIGGTEYSFVGPNTKGVVLKSAQKLVAGLNHMLAWSYGEQKYDFINKLNVFFVELHSYVTNPSFREGCFVDIADGVYKNIQEATAHYYKKFINNMDTDIYDGIVEYIDNNIIENTEDDKTELDAEDLFLVECITTITKIMIVGVSLLERYKLENYLYEPLLVATDKFQNSMANYYYNFKQERGERYFKIRNKDFKNTIYRYFYNELSKEFEGNNTGLFRNNGFSIDRIANEHYITGLCTISKHLPVSVETKSSQLYTLKDDYKTFKFVTKNTIRYLESTLHNMISDKLGTPFGGVISIIQYNRSAESDHNFYENAMKQELTLEKKSSSDMARRKHNIKLLKAFINDKVKEYNLLDNLKYTNVIVTPLTDFFIIKLLSEISEDTLTLKLLDKKTYLGLTLYISYVLNLHGYTNLSKAVMSDQLSPSEIAKHLDDKMDQITRLRKYHTNPTAAIEGIKKIVGYDYKDTYNGKMMHITGDFIQFLLNDQIDKFCFMGDYYIYDYEEIVEKQEEEKEMINKGI